ncbi:S53 family peptidase [Metallosphaera sedula]|uniref:S53 family peptidase n=1 Tax=Metallosphaera sedula TaxID=43687 RepID=UPI0020C0CB3D|nr:protease pro-enzyme activation domain-containing protein [Metallosphaera sedula]BBL46716.1 family S53 unassigned peptidase [Metallosphaera sedula]
MIKELLLIALILSQGIPLFHLGQDQVSTLPPSQLVTVSIVEKPQNLALLQLYVQEHKVLNKDQVESLFVPTEKIQQLVNYLHGYRISTSVSLNVITATGTVSQFEKALGGSFYVEKFHNLTFYQYVGASSPLVSNALVFSTNVTTSLLQRPSTLINVTQAVAFSQVTPSQLRYAYNVTPLLHKGINGTNVTIGIVDFYGDPYIQQQLQEFDSNYNISNPPFFKVESIGAYNPNDGISSGWALEISLDVEYAHVLAPGAGIILYVANPNASLPQVIAYIDQQDQVSVVSQSFGIPEIYVALGLIPLSMAQSLTYEYWLGEVEGITFVASSGDAGGNGYNFYLSPLGNLVLPASDPYVLAVGGTSVYYSNGSVAQTAWSGESLFGASTGGYSVIFPSPWYQGAHGFRMVPDVAADANPYTGVPVTYYYNISELVGGTSVASPLVAGILALAVQVHGKLGFINPLIYSLNGTKAISPVEYGYNTPYVVNGTPNPVTGLGYINAGYFVSMIEPGNGISVAVQNTTYLDGQEVNVVVKAPPSPQPVAQIYNGSAIVGQVPLTYNGTYWVGHFQATGSGVQEVIVTQGNLVSGSYFTVGLQAQYLLPQVALYPSPGNLPVLVHLTYPNGTTAYPKSQFSASLYSYNPETGQEKLISTIQLSHPLVLNFSQYGITITNASDYVFGTFPLNSSMVSGIYLVKVPGTYGFDEIVAGIYVVPYIVPGIATEPLVVAPGENFTLAVFAETLGSPNITVSFVKDGVSYFNTTINSVETSLGQFYVQEISLPKEIPSGYYNVVAHASYNFSNYTASGIGVTQIYVSPSPVQVTLSGLQETMLQNSTLVINASITYPNGTPVKYGTFTAIVIPSYLQDSFDTLAISNAVPLEYRNGSWIGYFNLPSGGSSNGLGLSPYGLAGSWQIYIDGVTYDGYPTALKSSLDYNTLSVIPQPYTDFVLLPYVLTPTFNGTSGYNLYILNATIINHNATLVNSVIYNLTAVNATVSLINSQVFHYTLTNSTLLNNTAITPVQILTTSVGHHGVVIPSTVTKNVTSTSAQNGTVIVALVILAFGLILAVYVWRRK